MKTTNSTQLCRYDDVYVTKCKLEIRVRQHIFACAYGEVLLRPVSRRAHTIILSSRATFCLNYEQYEQLVLQHYFTL